MKTRFPYESEKTMPFFADQNMVAIHLFLTLNPWNSSIINIPMPSVLDNYQNYPSTVMDYFQPLHNKGVVANLVKS
mgnify:FL=1